LLELLPLNWGVANIRNWLRYWNRFFFFFERGYYILIKDKYNVKNPNVSLSPTLVRNEKVEHYIRIKTHEPIALRFLVESGVKALYDWTPVSLVLYLSGETPSYKPN